MLNNRSFTNTLMRNSDISNIIKDVKTKNIINDP